jgi:hypothetical protein
MNKKSIYALLDCALIIALMQIAAAVAAAAADVSPHPFSLIEWVTCPLCGRLTDKGSAAWGLTEPRWYSAEPCGYFDLDVSTCGVPRKHSTGKLRKIKWDDEKYPKIGVVHHGVTKNKYLHVVVAEVFLGVSIAEEKLVVHHRNGRPGDPHVSNLERVTPSYNNMPINRKPRSVDTPNRARGVVRVERDGVISGSWRSVELTAIALKKSESVVCRHIQNKRVWPDGSMLKYACDVVVKDEDDNTIWKMVEYNSETLHASNVTGSIRRSNGEIIERGSKTGYRYISIRGVSVGVHYLVCLAFHGPPPMEGMTPDHINNDKNDDSADNLRWATDTEQAENRRTAVAVEQWTTDGRFLEKFDNISAAARKLIKNNIGLDSIESTEKSVKPYSSSIKACCNGRQKTAYGYVWKRHIKPAAAAATTSKKRARDDEDDDNNTTSNESARAQDVMLVLP